MDAEMLNAFYDGFVRCPNTGQILEILTGDNKVLCPCHKSNPKFLAERAEETGVHFVVKCERATAEEFITQEETRFASKKGFLNG